MDDYEVLTPNDDFDGPRAWCHVMYALHAISALGGLLTSATIVGAFITGWPSLVAVIINYATRRRVAASWLESHWRWQLRTFWFAVLWAFVALLLVITLFGIPLAWLVVVATGLWLLYRVGKGWLLLLDRKAIA